MIVVLWFCIILNIRNFTRN